MNPAARGFCGGEGSQGVGGELEAGARVRFLLSALGVSLGEYLFLSLVVDFALYATVNQVLPGHPAGMTISRAATLCAYLVYVTWGPSPTRNPWVWGEVRPANAVWGLLGLGVAALGRLARLELIPGRLIETLDLVHHPYALTFYVLAPISEELLYRGILLRRLSARLGFWPALVLSSAIFALLHPNPLRAFAVGAVLGYFYSPATSANLLAPVLLHILSNLTSNVPDWLISRAKVLL